MLKESNILFNEEQHRYFLGAKELSGVTGLIHRKVAPSLSYDFASTKVGTDAHADIEGVNLSYRFGVAPITTTTHGEKYLAWYNQFKDTATIEESEYIVTDGFQYASPIDIVFKNKFGEFIICDIKTYKNFTALYRNMARWQLSIYAYLFELQNDIEVHSAFVLQVTEDGCTEHTIELYPADKVKEFLYNEDFDCYAMTTTNNTIDKVMSLSDFVEAQEAQIKALQADLDTLKSKLMQEMRDNGFTKVKQGNMTFTIVEPSVSMTFDSKLFLEEHPEYKDQYTKLSPRKGYLKITKSKGE